MSHICAVPLQVRYNLETYPIVREGRHVDCFGAVLFEELEQFVPLATVEERDGLRLLRRQMIVENTQLKKTNEDIKGIHALTCRVCP